MANTHPANLGDVLKHIVLCEALTAPVGRYLESHAGAPEYDLAGAKPGPGGIWDFLEMKGDHELLRDCAYARLVGTRPGSSETPGTYLGSVGLALAALPHDVPIRVAEINKDTARALRAALSKARCTVFEGDGIAMVADEARRGDLVLIDPFKMSRNADHGEQQSPAEAFVSVARTGARVILWYPVHMPNQALSWMPASWPGIARMPFRIEVRRSNTQAGLAGCGVLVAGFPTQAESDVIDLAKAFGSSLEARWPRHRLHVMPSSGSGGDPLSPAAPSPNGGSP